jgi:hypothetical protein
MMSVRFLASFLVLIGLAQAADVQKYQSWSTLGQSSGIAWGETLLEIDEAPGGALVRFVYVGLRDVACGGITAMAWEKRVSQSPEAIVAPVTLCRLTQDVNRLVKRHHFALQGTENDGNAMVTQCGARRGIAGNPSQFTDLPEGSADEVYMIRIWALDERIMKTVWGANVPDIAVIDPAAERDGEEFVARARTSGYENDDPFQLLDRLLYSYKGPLGKPNYEWQIEIPAGVNVVQRDEPRLFRSAFGVGIKSSSTILRLTVDHHSGKVTNSQTLSLSGGDSWVIGRALWGATMNWVFDPATIPADDLVQVKVDFQAQCPPEQ